MRFWVFHCMSHNGNPLFIEAEDEADADRFFREMRKAGRDHTFDVPVEDFKACGYEEIRVVGKDEGLKPDPQTASVWKSAPVILVKDRGLVLRFGNPAHSGTFGMFRQRDMTTRDALTIRLECPPGGPSTWTLLKGADALFRGTDRAGMQDVVARLLRLAGVEPGFRNNFCAFLQKRLVRPGEYTVVPEELNVWADNGGAVY